MGAFGGWVLEDFIQIQGFNIVQLSIQNFIHSHTNILFTNDGENYIAVFVIKR